MPKLNRIYTGGGDKGQTSLGGGQRVDKDSLRIESYGTVDELNSFLGVAIASGLNDRLQGELTTIQNELFHLGSDLCFIEADKERFKIPQIESRHVEKLESLIDELSAVVGDLQNFILPGGSIGAAHLQVARTVCRRAERVVIQLAREEPVGGFVITYLNRLSDLLFVMGRYENHQKGTAEPLWDSHL